MKLLIPRLAKFLRYGGLRGHFGQYAEDVFLRKYFRGSSDGFYIDIGAHHPFQLSNTAGLWLAGWNGINIDASAAAIRLFNKIRPGDQNIHAAVVSTEMARNQSEISIFSSREIDNCATCDETLARERGLTIATRVPCISLADVINSAFRDGRRHIDLLNIDIEGLDEIVLSDVSDWAIKPTVIIAEIYGSTLRNTLESPTVTCLEAVGYQLVEKIGHSGIFVS